MHQRRAGLSSIFLALTIALTLLPAGPARPAAAQSSTPIPCSQSPFGAVIDLGREQELFLGFTVVDTGTPGALGGYRFDHDSEADAIHERELIVDEGTPNPSRDQISSRAATTADLNGDGRSEFIQSFSDGGNYQLTVYRVNGTPDQDGLLTDYQDDAGNHSERAMAGGDVLGLDNGREQVVVASRSPAGALTVQVFEGNDTGNIARKVAVWRSTTNNRAQPTKIQVATGNLDNDGYVDIVVAFQQASGNAIQFVYLEYEPNHQSGSGNDFAQNLVERAKGSEFANAPRSLRLELADLNGDSTDEVVLAHEQKDGAPISVAVFRYNLVDAGFDRRASGLFGGGNHGFDMATGDIDGISGNIRQEEIVLAFHSNGAFGFPAGLAVQALRLTALDTESPQLSSIAYLGDGNDGRNSARNVALAVADLNKDNRSEIVVAFSDSSPAGFQMAYLRYKSPQSFELVHSGRFDATLNAAPDLVAADWDNDSLRGKAQGLCERIVEHQVTSAVFVPPFWENMQGELFKEGSIGQSRAEESSVETSFTYSHGHAASAYLGISAGISLFDIVELGAAVKATASAEYSTSNRRASANITSEVRTVGRSFNDDGVAFEPANYKCYSYQLYENGVAVPVSDAGVRLCEYVPLDNSSITALAGSSLNGWDSNLGSETEYVPISRDWANRGLFRGAFAAQSSNQATAARALDSEIVAGSFVGAPVAETNVEDRPWWQVDLGAVQPISKIRIWAPPASLANFVVLVADSDFRQMPGHENPANLIGKAGVKAYTLADLGLSVADTANEVTTLLTLVNKVEPISGRFVRVQRNDTAALKLSEVQIFGPNHEDPDRYPLDVRDTDPDDGFFEAQLFNPYEQDAQKKFTWVKVRGRLIWGGNLNPNLPTLLSSQGGESSAYWSLSSTSGGSQISAQGIESNSSIGVEFDVEAGVLVKVQAGGAVSTTTGVAEETVFSSSWSNSFDLGGAVPNLPKEYDGQSWAARCQYGIRPYFYELSDQSSFGYTQRYTVLDYTVPDGSSHSFLLNRLVDLSDCRNGNQVASTPAPAPDPLAMTTGSPQTFFVLANDKGLGLRITGVGQPSNGKVSFSPRSITYTPNSGFVGKDSFSYTVTDAKGQTSTGTVTVTVDPIRVYLPGIRR